MAITFTPLHPVIAAECSGIDIGRTLTKGEAEVIDAGMDRYGVLIFRRAAPLTTEQQIAFTKNFGELYPRDLRRTTLTDGVPTVEQDEALAVGLR